MSLEVMEQIGLYAAHGGTDMSEILIDFHSVEDMEKWLIYYCEHLLNQNYCYCIWVGGSNATCYSSLDPPHPLQITARWMLSCFPPSHVQNLLCQSFCWDQLVFVLLHHLSLSPSPRSPVSAPSPAYFNPLPLPFCATLSCVVILLAVFLVSCGCCLVLYTFRLALWSVLQLHWFFVYDDFLKQIDSSGCPELPARNSGCTQT